MVRSVILAIHVHLINCTAVASVIHVALVRLTKCVQVGNVIRAVLVRLTRFVAGVQVAGLHALFRVLV